MVKMCVVSHMHIHTYVHQKLQTNLLLMDLRNLENFVALIFRENLKTFSQKHVHDYKLLHLYYST